MVNPQKSKRQNQLSASTVYTPIYKRDMRSLISGLFWQISKLREGNVNHIVNFIMSRHEATYYMIYVFLKIECPMVIKKGHTQFIMDLVRTIFDQMHKYHNNVLIPRNYEPLKSKY